MIRKVASTGIGCSIMIIGSNSMPTDTKNSTAKASRSGSESDAALWLRSPLSSMPAKNAPSAKDTPNSFADPKATPSAIASTDSVNSSREPKPATFSSTQGMARLPTTIITATKALTFRKVQPSEPRIEPVPARSPSPAPMASARAGSSTSAATITRSSTISQPTAILPRRVSSRRRSSMARSSTTVLATDSARPNTRPCRVGQPMNQARPQPSTVAVAICTMAPGMAIAFTSSRSSTEKCRPTPNISRITPISDSSMASDGSATKPGVKGPTRMPASR